NFPEDNPTYDPNIVKTLCNPIDDHTVKLIINNNKDAHVTIDKEDYDKIKFYKWYIRDNTYVVTQINNKSYRLHRFVTNTTDPKIFIDHIDSNTFNNTKNNLRELDAQGNN